MAPHKTTPSSALDEIPMEPEQITREWLFEVINQFRRSRGFIPLEHPGDIIDCSIDECDRSHGYLSTTYKLLAHFKCNQSDSETCSYSFFLKMLPGVEDRHKLLLYQSGSFRREVEALFNLLPAMKRFAEERNAEAVVAAPTIVYGAYDDQGLGVVALMDLNDNGFLPLNHYNGFNLAQILTVVEKLAEFHAVGSAMIISKREENIVNKFKELDSAPQDCQFLHDSLGSLFKDFARFLRKVPGYGALYETVEKARPNLVTYLFKPKTFKAPLKTFLHGELWEKNLLLRFERISETLDVIFCDWKSVQIGYPCQDLALLVLASTGQGTRNRSTKQILEKYFFTYQECLRKLDINFSKMFPHYQFNDFREDFESALMSAFLQTALIMTREVRYLEAEFANAAEEEQLTELGTHLRELGRRLLDMAETFVPKMEQEEKILNKNTAKNGRVKFKAK